jgi:RNA polymerase sigma factor (sigma-70 family)
MEVSALRYSGGIGVHARSPLLRLQSDERLIALTRRGNQAAFEVLVSRYNSRLLAFCRHLLGSREDAEDVLQEVFAAAFNAMVADERPINVRPWLYRIARNRSLNHLRRATAIGVDSMDVHLSEHGATTADKVHDREQFRMLVGDIQGLPETQRTALILREMDALSYEQIAEAMDTTVPGVKSLLVRARISLAESAEARQLSCEEVRIELAEVAEGLRKKPSSLVRRHMRSCNRCSAFQSSLKHTNRALAALLPLGPIALLKKLALVHFGSSAGTSSGAAGATGATAGAGGAAGAVGATAVATSTGGAVTAGVGAIATKAAAGLAAAIVTVGAVDLSHTHQKPAVAHHHHAVAVRSVEVAPTTVHHSSSGGTSAGAVKAAQLAKATANRHHHHKLAHTKKAGKGRLKTKAHTKAGALLNKHAPLSATTKHVSDAATPTKTGTGMATGTTTTGTSADGAAKTGTTTTGSTTTESTTTGSATTTGTTTRRSAGEHKARTRTGKHRRGGHHRSTIGRPNRAGASTGDGTGGRTTAAPDASPSA